MQLTITQAAERLELSAGRVYMLCRAGRLGQKIGRQYLIDSADLARFRRLRRRPGRPRKTSN